MRQLRWILLLLIFSWTAAPARAGWRLESQNLPPMRGGQATFDPGHGLLYLTQDRWSLFQIDIATGRARSLQDAASPAPYWLSGKLEYDATRNQLIAMGGSFGSGTGAVTYSIATGTWRLTVIPTPNSGSMLSALDLRRDRLLAWAGDDTLWTYQLANSQWGYTRIQPPTNMSANSIAADSLRDRMIVHGTALGVPKTWTLDLSGAHAWAQLPVQGTLPLAASRSQLFVDPVDERVVLAGDWMNEYSDPAASREVSTLALASSSGPSWFIRRPYSPPSVLLDDARTRLQPQLAFDRVGGALWSFGGATVRQPDTDAWPERTWITITPTNETLRLDLRGSGGWHTVAPFGPPSLDDQALARDPVSGRAFLVGSDVLGPDSGLRTFEFMTGPTNGGGYRLLTPGTIPIASRLNRKRLLVDVVGHRLVLIAATSGSAQMLMFTMPIDGPYVWSSMSLPANTPPLREGMSVVTDPRTRRFIFFGGEANGVYSNQTHVLTMDHGPEWVQVTGSAPVGRAGHVAVFDPVAERMLIFGGQGANGARTDTWQIDLTDSPSWTQSATLIPVGVLPAIPPRTDAVGMWDAANHRLLVVGGRSTVGVRSDCWQLDVDAEVPEWTPIAAPLPSGRSRSTVMHDPSSGRWWMAGGVDANGAGVNEVWSYQDALSVVGVGPGSQASPGVALAAPRPNPSLASVTLSFSAPPGAQGRLEIFDVRGRRVRTLPVTGGLGASNQLVWDGRGESGRALPAGVYLCRLQAGGASSTRRVTLLH